MLNTAVESELFKNPDITDEEIYDILSSVRMWCTVKIIAELRAEYYHTLRYESPKEQQFRRRSICKGTGDSYHKTQKVIVDITLTYFLCDNCDRVRRHTSDSMGNHISDRLLSMKKSKKIRHSMA